MKKRKGISIIDVAKKAGVSKSTASRAMRNSYGISEDTRQKVLLAAEELKYRPNISARNLRSKTGNLLGILISSNNAEHGIVHLVNSRKISGIVNKARELEYDVIVFIEDISDHARLNRIIKEKGIKGIIFLDIVPSELLDNFRMYGIPYVLVNWLIPGYNHQCFVKTDLEKATIIALDHLTSRGYHDIGVINWENEIIEHTFTNYMKSKGLNYADCVWNTSIDPGYESLVRYLETSNKRAYLSFSYFCSIYILKYCRDKGISIPKDIALLSYEFFDFFDFLEPPLSGIKQPAEEMGRKAAEKLVAMINGDSDVSSEFLDPILVSRETC